MTKNHSVFVSEAICGGAWRDRNLSGGLLKEGYSMWSSLLEDLVQQPSLKVITTCDDRLTPPSLPGLVVHPIKHVSEEQELFLQLAEQAEETLVIAPETGHLLEQRINSLNSLNKGNCMSTPAATRLAADKWAFYELCLKLDIPTPRTWKLEDFQKNLQTLLPVPFPWLVKPQFGAGASDSLIIDTLSCWESQQDFLKNSPEKPFIVQPLIESTPGSLSVIVNPVSGEILWCPPGRQNFSGLEYQGGTIPQFQSQAEEIQSWINKIFNSVSGFRGYLGFDFLVTPTPENKVLLLELNPRLTTSYLGYRQLFSSNLTCGMLGISSQLPQTWKTQTVNFTHSGHVSFENSR